MMVLESDCRQLFIAQLESARRIAVRDVNSKVQWVREAMVCQGEANYWRGLPAISATVVALAGTIRRPSPGPRDHSQERRTVER
jgi:hypothetical protein